MFLPLRVETPQLRFPSATVALIALNLAVFLYEVTLTPPELLTFARAAGVVPWEVSHFHDLVGAGQPHDLVPPPFTILTSMFVHGDVVHLGGNLWFLWLFGSRLEGRVGALRFLVLYFVSGVLAAVLQVVAIPDNTMPMIGASGGIAGALGAYALCFPKQQVRCLVFVVFFVTFVSLPGSVLLGLWFMAQFVSAGGRSPGIAWYAHIGGFLLGLGLARLLLRRAPRLRIAYHPSLGGRAREEAGRGRLDPGPTWPNAPVPTT